MPELEHLAPLHSERIFSDSEGKKFFVDLMKNDRGNFVQITERKGSHRTRVMIPLDAVKGISDALASIAARKN